MTLQITFYPSGRTCPIEANETVLEACLYSGLSPDYGCSNGNCGSCSAKLKSGTLEPVGHHDFAFSTREKQDGGFLMCVNRAISDIEIEVDVTKGPEDIPVQEIETKVKSVSKSSVIVIGPLTSAELF